MEYVLVRIDLITVLDAILLGRQSGQKLVKKVYGTRMANNFISILILHNL